MAFVTQSANLVRQKTFMINRSPGVFYALKALFLHLAANKGNPDLKIFNIDGTNTASDGGATANQVASDSACTLYAIFLKKVGATATWFKGTDNATTASTNGSEDVHQVVTTANEEDLFLYPTGHALANGFTLTETTTATGATANLKANAIYGYVILGA